MNEFLVVAFFSSLTYMLGYAKGHKIEVLYQRIYDFFSERTSDRNGEHTKPPYVL